MSYFTLCIHSFMDGNGRTGRFLYHAFMDNTVVSGNSLQANASHDWDLFSVGYVCAYMNQQYM